MANVGDISVKLGLDVSDFQKGLQESESKLKSFGSRIGGIGKKLTASVSVPLATLGVGAIKVGADFEKSMKKVQAVTGASEKQFGQLEGKARDLGSSTTYSAKEVADAMGFLGMAGFKTNDILDATGDMLNLATIGNLDLARTADIASNMLTGMGLEASDMGKVVDTMAKTMTNSNVDIEMLGESFKYVAPVASSLGVDLSELSATIGMLGDAGIQGGMAGTSLSTGLNRLAKPSKESAKLMKKLGINAWDANGKLKSMPNIIAELEGGLDGLSDQQRADALATIFGLESVKSWSTLINRGSGELAKFAKEIDGANGAGQELADTMNDTLYARINGLTSALSDVGITIYKMVAPALKTIVEKLTDVVRWFGSLDSSTIAVVGVLGGLAMILPVIALGLGLFMQGLSFVIGGLGMIISPITLTIAGIGLLAGALVLAWQKSETFRDIVTTAFTYIKDIAVDVFQVVASFVKDKISEIKDFWDTNGNQIKQAFENVVNAIGTVFKVVFPIIKDIVLSTIKQIMGIVDGLITFFEGVIEFFAGVFTGDWKKAWEGIKKIFSGALKAIWNFIQLTLIGKVLKFFKGFGGKIAGHIKDIGKILMKPFKAGWNWVKSIISSMKKGVKSTFDNVVNSTKSVLSKVTNFITNPFKKGWNSAKSTINSLKNGVKSGFTSAKNSIKSAFSNVKNIITKPFTSAWNKIKGIPGKIKSAFNKMKIKIPRFKLPKISVGSKSFLDGKVKIPTFKVTWNAKGNIFNGASILGGGQGVGEAGAEAVLPIEHKRYMKPFASSIADHLKDMNDTNSNGDVTNNFNISSIVVREEADIERIAKELERLQRNERRAKGKFAY